MPDYIMANKIVLPIFMSQKQNKDSMQHFISKNVIIYITISEYNDS